MSIRCITTAKGEKRYYYQFEMNGKAYRGTCHGCTNKKDAAQYEAKIYKNTEKLAEQKDLRQLTVNFRDQLIGGCEILLKDGYDESKKKPRTKIPGERRDRLKRSHWDDFVAFMNGRYPDVIKLTEVTRQHAKEYISYIRSDGAYRTKSSYNRGGHSVVMQKTGALQGATLQDYQHTLTEVFSLLQDDLGTLENPFVGIPKPPRESETRDIFSIEDLKMIDDKSDDFTRPLFRIGLWTAMREGDICRLRWSEVDLPRKVITRQQSKTKNTVTIPIMPPLLDYFKTLKALPASDPQYAEYVLPVHAKMYIENRNGVSYRIKKFLEKDCQIETTRIPEGRTKAVSVKDFHSCRHTFCYLAGLQKIPLNIVQTIVGHMTPQMTQLYSNHADIETKREQMKQLLSILPTFDDAIPVTAETVPESTPPKPLPKQLTPEEQERRKLFEEINRCMANLRTMDLKKLLKTSIQLKRENGVYKLTPIEITLYGDFSQYLDCLF